MLRRRCHKAVACVPARETLQQTLYFLLKPTAAQEFDLKTGLAWQGGIARAMITFFLVCYLGSDKAGWKCICYGSVCEGVVVVQR